MYKIDTLEGAYKYLEITEKYVKENKMFGTKIPKDVADTRKLAKEYIDKHTDRMFSK